MERRTIGGFIAVLRKANGMTQKELAEKLNVSDKAVSRWERDECAPDLTLIPVLAEIFGVTSDELLRGEKATARQTEETVAAKTQKQLDRLLESNATKLKIRSIIASGIAAVGLIAAMICNSALLRSSLGFFVGCIFYLAAAISEACFAVAAFSAVKAEDFDEEKLSGHKQRLWKIITAVEAVIVVMFTVTLPLILGGVYVGIDAGDWLGYAIVFLLILGVAAAFISWVTRVILAKKGRIKLNENTVRKDKLKIKVSVITSGIMLVTALCHAGVYTTVPTSAFAAGTVHETVEEFKEYIETPAPYSSTYYEFFYEVHEEAATQILNEYLPDDNTAESEQEWEDILKENEEAFVRNGKEVFRYSHINESVVEIHWGDSENGMPVTTYTSDDLRYHAEGVKGLVIHGGFMLVYLAEIIIGVVVYRKKR
ncbi:MAG: helix-turn-helix transcriptional regulator [Clostridia bacterium]|nr:helix-turn-helix transcriptional regulator [Clostridia bacterium]